jgi:single-strand DNA-binding protein
MANFNRVILAGNLTRDPQLSYLPNNTPLCEFGMAINSKWRGQDGEMRDDTCFVDLRIYGRQAETFNQYMSKGQPVLVEGRLKFDQWEGKDGQKRNRLRVHVDRFEFLGGQGGGQAGGRGEAGRPDYAPAPAQPAAAPDAPPPPVGPEESPPPTDDPGPTGEDIPF